MKVGNQSPDLSGGSSDITPEVYREAALELLPVLGELYRNGQYVMATYVSGLAVECIFRAHYVLRHSQFDSRHDLYRLYGKSRFAELFPQQKIQEYAGHIAIITTHWNNGHRYRSEKALRAYWKRAKLDRTVRKGDFLKELTRRVVNAAIALVTIGALGWVKAS